ncbi:hypothetical protein V6B14_03770 [Sporosarcina psychrophila]|uniref:hypothetical protein n=1 Tax=Sporosarcina psychrophila TaxID=1476 RepID=UPI0030D2AED9
MNLLIKESPLQVLPSLAMQVGLNAVIVLQQLYFRLLISTNVRDGHKWVYKTYEEWRNEKFPFWSVDTIKRAIRRLEDSGYIISTSSYKAKLQSVGGSSSPTDSSCFHEDLKLGVLLPVNPG